MNTMYFHHAQYLSLSLFMCVCCVAQVAALVSYLCSEEAKQVTGATLPIDGGWTAV